MQSTIHDLYKKIASEYESYKKKYNQIKRDKIVAQAMSYCIDKPAIIYRDGVLSNFIESDPRFNIINRGKIYLRVTSPVGNDGGPTSWTLDTDIYEYGYIVWSNEPESESSSDELLSDSDEDDKISLRDIKHQYNIHHANIVEDYLQSIADNNFTIKNKIAISYVNSAIILARVDPKPVEEFIKTYTFP